MIDKNYVYEHNKKTGNMLVWNKFLLKQDLNDSFDSMDQKLSSTKLRVQLYQVGNPKQIWSEVLDLSY